ncbi:NupC/NupG family nucleoside CNT transporter [Acetobacter orleanensis]|uniref:Nucleoside permease n=1 Tax=Acetobacter orleanensis TaxID=104099 RepID=A0A4Y3TQU0_9PROT|nr:nucleoside transporter C-terminal domain-containing protein [Acetobacter orleanensis]KXV66929.1 nucleoside permease [Acetobacter orleanensis]PCD78689.1 NupC/NupG family nucleoside CNT transporter [Acetobacter orleanensis]GAN67335.1 nucleoside permease [Acetobacter orleanensis JCM 7639]GBR28630.1 nucleoside permease [Acetobacter orleanensis NRIC 0473]GEB83380.1 nucleoside permease [Acetobacter orleanensis]
MHSRGCLGIVLLLGIAVLFSRDRKNISVRTVLSCLLAQIAIGLLVLRVPVGQQVLWSLSQFVTRILSCGDEGARFLFGALASDKMDTIFPHDGFVFAFRVLPSLVYVSALIAILFHVGVMQIFARATGKILQKVLNTSPVESFGAVITIFIGQSELPVALGPYLRTMTPTELFSVLCSGVASVSGATLVGYVGLGVPAHYLVAASFMAIPGGMLFAKILAPRVAGSPVDTLAEARSSYNQALFETITEGAMKGTKTAVAVAATLVAFIGLIALINSGFQALGQAIDMPFLSLEYLFGLMFSPIAWVLGVPAGECTLVGSVLGLKLVINEFVAYLHLSPSLQNGALSARSGAIATFALCGFANLSSIGILVAAFGSQCPERRAELAHISTRAVLAGMLSNFMSAAIAGVILV